VLGILVVLLLGGCLAFLYTIDFSVPPEEVPEHFAGLPYEPRFETFDFEGRPMHYAEVGDPAKPLVVFVHGSPGSWDAFINFMTRPELLEQARIISVDRPGFGESGPGRPERSLERQAAAINHIIEQRNAGRPAILVGHSYGGPVIARMAIDRPDLVEGLVLVAASVDPQLEETKWFQIPAHWPFMRWILPGMLVVSNEEILALKGELEAMAPLWGRITVPVTVIQGEADSLVPAANADYARARLISAPVHMVRVPGMDHFVPWQRADLIMDALQEHLDGLD